MTINALFEIDGIACLMSDHLAVTPHLRYVTRKSSYISPQLVVAASGDEVSADLALSRLFNRFSSAPVSRKTLLNDTLAQMRDLREHPCVLIGWLIEGRKKPVSFRWDSKWPANPRVRQKEFTEGLGHWLYRDVVPPYTEHPWGSPFEKAAVFCVERAATLWINEVAYRGMSRVGCGGGFDIYICDTQSKPYQFRWLDDVGYLHFRITYQQSGNALLHSVVPQRDYTKDTYGAVLSSHRASRYRVSTVAIGSPQQGRSSTGQVIPPIPPAARMYACCFVVWDLRTNKDFVEILTATGQDAARFSINLARDPAGQELLQFSLPRVVINRMAMVVTRRVLSRGMRLA